MNNLKKRGGNECKKTDCIRYNDRYNINNPTAMKYCKECKWTFPSQFERKKTEVKA